MFNPLLITLEFSSDLLASGLHVGLASLLSDLSSFPCIDILQKYTTGSAVSKDERTSTI